MVKVYLRCLSPVHILEERKVCADGFQVCADGFQLPRLASELLLIQPLRCLGNEARSEARAGINVCSGVMSLEMRHLRSKVEIYRYLHAYDM